MYLFYRLVVSYDPSGTELKSLRQPTDNLRARPSSIQDCLQTNPSSGRRTTRSRNIKRCYRGRFISILFVLPNFLESSSHFVNSAFFGFSKISVLFAFVSKFSPVLIKWKTPHITKEKKEKKKERKKMKKKLRLFNIVSRLVGECFVAVSIERFSIF